MHRPVTQAVGPNSSVDDASRTDDADRGTRFSTVLGCDFRIDGCGSGGFQWIQARAPMGHPLGHSPAKSVANSDETKSQSSVVFYDTP
jgi:hypothetical protein